MENIIFRFMVSVRVGHFLVIFGEFGKMAPTCQIDGHVGFYRRSKMKVVV